VRAWLRQPLLIPRYGFLGVGLLAGLAIMGLVIAAPIVLSNLRAERDRAIKAETLTKGEIVALVQRVSKLERPSNLEIDYRIRVGLRRCIKSPACLRNFQRLSRVIRRNGHFVLIPLRPPGVPAPADHPAPGSTGSGSGPRGSPGSPGSPGRTGRPGSPGGGSSGGGGSGGGGGGGGAGGGAPTIPGLPIPRPNIPLPNVPRTCTPVIGVNCP
jgi:hypothetical protein